MKLKFCHPIRLFNAIRLLDTSEYVHAKGSLVGANLISIPLKGGTKIHESHSYQRKVI